MGQEEMAISLLLTFHWRKLNLKALPSYKGGTGNMMQRSSLSDQSSYLKNSSYAYSQES